MTCLNCREELHPSCSECSTASTCTTCIDGWNLDRSINANTCSCGWNRYGGAVAVANPGQGMVTNSQLHHSENRVVSAWSDVDPGTTKFFRGRYSKVVSHVGNWHTTGATLHLTGNFSSGSRSIDLTHITGQTSEFTTVNILLIGKVLASILSL